MSGMQGKTILYTGGAGGLGLETTMHFLDAGARVVVIDRDEAKMAALAEAASAHHAERLLIRDFDLADLSGLKKELGDIQASFGEFNVVINNAAIYPSKPFHEFTVEEHQAVQRVNVDAAIVCVQAALPSMRKNQWGRIINITSITFYGGWALLAPYVQSKGALVGLARAWAREYGVDGITANAVSGQKGNLVSLHDRSSKADEHTLAFAVGEIGLAPEILTDTGLLVAAGREDVIA